MPTLDAIADWPVNSAAAAVVVPSGVVADYGDIRKRFALASVTKPLVARAAQIAIEEGVVELDTEAGPPGWVSARPLAGQRGHRGGSRRGGADRVRVGQAVPAQAVLGPPGQEPAAEGVARAHRVHHRGGRDRHRQAVILSEDPHGGGPVGDEQATRAGPERLAAASSSLAPGRRNTRSSVDTLTMSARAARRWTRAR